MGALAILGTGTAGAQPQICHVSGADGYVSHSDDTGHTYCRATTGPNGGVASGTAWLGGHAFVAMDGGIGRAVAVLGGRSHVTGSDSLVVATTVGTSAGSDYSSELGGPALLFAVSGGYANVSGDRVECFGPSLVLSLRGTCARLF